MSAAYEASLAYFAEAHDDDEDDEDEDDPDSYRDLLLDDLLRVTR